MPESNPSSLSRTLAIEQIVQLFSCLPTLRQVAASQVQSLYPGIAIGIPLQDGIYRYSPLADEILECMSIARPVRYVQGHHIVARHARENFVPDRTSLASLEREVNRLAGDLLEAWLAQLQDAWREPLSTGASRWEGVSEKLLALFYDAEPPPGLDEQQFARIFPQALLRASLPERLEGLRQSAMLNIRTLHAWPRGTHQPAETLPLLLLEHRLFGAETHILMVFSPAMGIYPLTRLQDVEALLPEYVSERLKGQALTWFAEEPLGNPFDALAVSYAERQWADVKAIDRAVPRTPAQYQAMLDYLTDPRRWFESRLTPRQQRVQAALPLWLVHAGIEDSLAYAGALETLLDDEAQGNFLEGIAPIRTYAAQTLKLCLGEDPRAREIEPDEVELTYAQVTAVAMPGGFTGGEVQRTTVSLTALALENLGGFPHTPSQIRVKGAPAPAWLTAERLRACVSEADVGQRYPALLKQKLLDDPAERSRREALFTRQLRTQLPLLALEMKIKGEGALTEAGQALVAAAVQGLPAATLWPLAFKATATATADGVVNQFIIGPRQADAGPHLLYRPLLRPSLREFSSAQALFEAICTAGDLQNSVLAWMAPERQPVYANGGFNEPHVRCFLAGDEFNLPPRPQPARLFKQLEDGDPLPRVFSATAQALISLAQAEAVSNARQRWATLKAGGWLLFNAVLPFVSGPALLAGWLVQVMDSVRQDLTGRDPAQGVAQLLADLVLILAHRASPHTRPPRLNLQHRAFARSPVEPPVVMAQVPVRALNGWYTPRATLSPLLQARLEQLSLKAYARPWPQRLANAQTSGRLRGLARDDSHVPAQWQVLLHGHLYRAQVSAEGVRVVSADAATPGPWLKPVGEDRWEVDLHLRLRGGQADTSAISVNNEARRQQLELDYQLAIQRRQAAHRALDIARQVRAAGVTEAQRVTANARYNQELENKLDASMLELQCLRQLQVLKPRPAYEREVSAALEGVILTLHQLLQQGRDLTLAVNARLLPLLQQVEFETPEEAQSDLNQQAHRNILQNMRDLADGYDKAIRWTHLETSYLNELSGVPKFGRDKVRELQAGVGKRPSALDLQSLQVTTLWGVALNTEGLELDEEFFQSLEETIHRARWASRSQATLGELAPQSTALRIELLESFDHVYAQTQDRLAFWRAMEPGKFNLTYLDKLRELFSQLQQQVQDELALALLPAPAPVEVPALAVPNPRQKRIIRTRNQDLYVARLKMSTGAQPVEVAEVTDTQQAVLGAFTQAADGVWEPVKAPADSRPTPTPNLNRLIEQGQALRASVERAITQVQKMARTASEAQSLQDILEQRADKLRQCADSIHQRLLHADTERLAALQRARARTEADDLRAAASRLSEEGMKARLSVIKARLPTQSGLDVLVSHREVRVLRLDARVALAGRANDFLQAYAVMDVHSREPWCYGHFHYERAIGPDDHFTAAHLKTPAQHRLGKQAQAQVRAQAFASIQAGQTGRVEQTLEIHRGEINLRMARKLFFDAPLWTPDW
ncbi:hypothetical protein [Pseudomonas sp.]|uniref:hypothetical protein n=1 Tax=Pseudomonas sp. TaxID=306 RepID=UPI003C3CEB0E